MTEPFLCSLKAFYLFHFVSTVQIQNGRLFSDFEAVRVWPCLSRFVNSPPWHGLPRWPAWSCSCEDPRKSSDCLKVLVRVGGLRPQSHSNGTCPEEASTSLQELQELHSSQIRKSANSAHVVPFSNSKALSRI